MNVNKHEGDLLRFASKHNLRSTGGCNDSVILGSRGEVYQYGPNELGLMILPKGANPTPRLWNRFRTKCQAAGMSLLQNGDAEGALSFDPENDEQARLAIKAAGIRPKRKLSAEHKRKLLEGKKRYDQHFLRVEGILEGVSCL